MPPPREALPPLLGTLRLPMRSPPAPPAARFPALGLPARLPAPPAARLLALGDAPARLLPGRDSPRAWPPNLFAVALSP